jgi:hypothetical protein
VKDIGHRLPDQTALSGAECHRLRVLDVYPVAMSYSFKTYASHCANNTEMDLEGGILQALNLNEEN